MERTESSELAQGLPLEAPVADPTELSDDDLEFVIGGLARPWHDVALPGGSMVHPAGAE